MVSVSVQHTQQGQAAQQAEGGGLRQQIISAIQNAANKTGVNFAYLLNKAQAESGGDPNATASTSTATGLFQFTGQTWLKMVKNYGAQYGIGNYANHISVDSDGTAHVNDPTWKQAILGLRKDPQLSAEMAGELDKENNASLQANVGGKIGSTELYLAHFLGASGASEFLNTLRANPSAKAAEILPEAASANTSVFYGTDGQPRSLAQIYQHFAQKFNTLPNAPSTMVASASATSVAAQYVAPQIASATSTYAMSPYVVADATAARSSYAASVPDMTNKIDSSSLLATMILAQMKTDRSATQSLSASNVYSTKKDAISILGSVA